MSTLMSDELPKKKRKVAVLVCDDSQVWLSCNGICLTMEDKRNLIEGLKLSDRHINYSQKLLQNQFPDMGGLGPTLLQRRKPINVIRSGIQIIHDKGDHWVIAARNVYYEDNIIKVYDSVYHSIDSDTKEICFNLFDVSISEDVTCCTGIERYL